MVQNSFHHSEGLASQVVFQLVTGPGSKTHGPVIFLRASARGSTKDVHVREPLGVLRGSHYMTRFLNGEISSCRAIALLQQ
jgi:hypothetical protein